MDDAAKELVLLPFVEIVARGTAARDNAAALNDDDDDQDHRDHHPDGTSVKPVMLKAANALLREGERAVRRIEPLCDKLLAVQGDIFIDALRENDEIAEYRTELSDLLWEFDDFIEPEGFDAERFTELQMLSRVCAPRIVDILMRMRLEPITPCSLAEHPMHLGGVDNYDSEAPENTPYSPGPRFDFSFPGNVSEDAPPCPVRSPWRPVSRQSLPPTSFGQGLGAGLNNGDAAFRHHPAMPTRALSFSTGIRPGPLPSPPMVHDAMSQHSRPADDKDDNSRDPAAATTPLRVAKPTHDGGHGRTLSDVTSSASVTTRSTNRSLLSSVSSYDAGKMSLRNSRGSSVTDSHFSFSSERRDSACEAVSPITPLQRSPALPSSAEGGFAPLTGCEKQKQQQEQNPPLSPLSEREIWDEAAVAATTTVSPTMAAEEQLSDEPGLERASSHSTIDSGLIPVEAEKAPRALVLQEPSRIPDCTIDSQSSFYRLKGFCEGAKEALKSGGGFKPSKKLNFSGGYVVASRCKSCMFELDWNEIEADRKELSSANYMSKSSGVGFRLRFLAKSHVASRSVDDQIYACLFCAELGHTVEESDATVFFSQRQLFLHISRHPRPLPAVRGLVVVEEVEMPAGLRNKYDLHLPKLPGLSRLAEDKSLAIKVELLPMATALMTVKQAYGTLKTPPDKATSLQFAVGAKIFGVEFPEQYGGEWAVGWADNVHGAFPVDAIKLEAPPKAQTALGGIIANRRAVVRWKFAPREKGEWLRLEKGEVISDIGWVHPGHWCWSGTNSKGKWGIFPRSHMDIGTLKEGDDTLEVRASANTQAKKSPGLFSRVSLRVRAGSSSSGTGGTSGGRHSAKVRPSFY